ncbi:hypothetical protein [Aminobacter sp. AP02]|uniref:hypothetical protein n=1 Tax=Aminobacter sp. AP02 TaxID=2135737 RepID=UPI0032AF67C3
MALRKVEVQLKASQEKVLSQAVELSRLREAQKVAAADHTTKQGVVSELEAKRGNLREEIGKRDAHIKGLAAQLAEAQRLLEQRAREAEEMGRLYEEATLSSSSRQIELVSRESELGKLSDDMSTLRHQRSDSDRRLSELEADNKAVREALKVETRRAGELDRKLQEMAASLGDRDEKIEQREGELARAREQLNTPHDAPETNSMTNGAAQALERERLEGRLTVLARENKRLKGELAKAGRNASTPGQDSQLREQMHELAAEVVALTARLEGPNSPISSLLGNTAEFRASVNGDRPAVISLADRVRALQKSPAAE